MNLIIVSIIVAVISGVIVYMSGGDGSPKL